MKKLIMSVFLVMAGTVFSKIEAVETPSSGSNVSPQIQEIALGLYKAWEHFKVYVYGYHKSKKGPLYELIENSSWWTIEKYFHPAAFEQWNNCFMSALKYHLGWSFNLTKDLLPKHGSEIIPKANIFYDYCEPIIDQLAKQEKYGPINGDLYDHTGKIYIEFRRLVEQQSLKLHEKLVPLAQNIYRVIQDTLNWDDLDEKQQLDILSKEVERLTLKYPYFKQILRIYEPLTRQHKASDIFLVLTTCDMMKMWRQYNGFKSWYSQEIRTALEKLQAEESNSTDPNSSTSQVEGAKSSTQEEDKK